MDLNFFKGKSVLITGDQDLKELALQDIGNGGARVTGYALESPLPKAGIYDSIVNPV